MTSNGFFDSLAHLGITHHHSRTIRDYLEKDLFREIDFTNKSVLDIGGGKGLCSFFAAWKGANRVVNVEPVESGSEADVVERFMRAGSHLQLPQCQIVSKRIQEIPAGLGVFDIVIVHDAINHLDEAAYSQAHLSCDRFQDYVALVRSIRDLHAIGGVLVIADCARRNFWGDLGLRSPFAPTINWKIHQNPSGLRKIVHQAGYLDIRWEWTPLKRAGLLGRIIAKFGFASSYFLQSHFVMWARNGR
jgi:SAM-dependent methyltransferase